MIGQGNKYGRMDMDGSDRKRRFAEDLARLDCRDINLLRRFLTQNGKIMPARFTGATAKQQREIASAIRRTRVMGLLP